MNTKFASHIVEQLKKRALEREMVDSSNIESIGYDESTNTLEVAFKSGGVYEYLDVPKDVYEEFLAAGSKGSFLHWNIKPDYRYRRVS